jgi:hypothetical protein
MARKIIATRTRLAAQEMWRLVPCRALKPFLKFETKARSPRQVPASSKTHRCQKGCGLIQNRGEIA